jgi:hypothetical protein
MSTLKLSADRRQLKVIVNLIQAANGTRVELLSITLTLFQTPIFSKATSAIQPLLLISNTHYQTASKKATNKTASEKDACGQLVNL